MPSNTTKDAIRAAILKAPAYRSETVHVDAWDADLEVRSLAVGVRNELAARVQEPGHDKRAFACEVLIASAYDADGNLVFTQDDVPWLLSLDAAAVDVPASVALRLNGLGGKSGEEAVAEEAGKSAGTES